MKNQVIVQEYDGDRCFSGGFKLIVVAGGIKAENDGGTYMTSEERSRELRSITEKGQKAADDIGVKLEKDLLRDAD